MDGEPTITCKKFDYVLDETVTEENPLEIIVKLNASETIGHVNVQIEAGDDLFGDAIK